MHESGTNCIIFKKTAFMRSRVYPFLVTIILQNKFLVFANKIMKKEKRNKQTHTDNAFYYGFVTKHRWQPCGALKTKSKLDSVYSCIIDKAIP